MGIEPQGSTYIVTGSTTLTVDPTAVGDILVLAAQVFSSGSDAPVQIESVTGGGVETWTMLAQNNPSDQSGDAELWFGVVTETGSSTIVVTIESTESFGVTALSAQQFTYVGASGVTWTAAGSANSTDTGTATSGDYPTLTPLLVNQLWVGSSILLGGSASGSATGFTYTTVGSGGAGQFVYGLGGTVQPSAPVAPPWGQGADSPFANAAALINAQAPPIDTEIVFHTWSNADGTVPNGRVVFTLSGQVEGAVQNTVVGGQPIHADLLDGYIQQQLVPNINSDLSPNGTFYWVSEQIVGSPPVEYPITVPTGGPFDLWTLRQQS